MSETNLPVTGWLALPIGFNGRAGRIVVIKLSVDSWYWAIHSKTDIPLQEVLGVEDETARLYWPLHLMKTPSSAARHILFALLYAVCQNKNRLFNDEVMRWAREHWGQILVAMGDHDDRVRETPSRAFVDIVRIVQATDTRQMSQGNPG